MMKSIQPNYDALNDDRITGRETRDAIQGRTFDSTHAATAINERFARANRIHKMVRAIAVELTHAWQADRGVPQSERSAQMLAVYDPILQHLADALRAVPGELERHYTEVGMERWRRTDKDLARDVEAERTWSEVDRG